MTATQFWSHWSWPLATAVIGTVFLIGTFTNPLVEGNLVAGITVGGKGLGPSGTFPRIMSLFINIPGTLFLLGGAVYSIILFAAKKEYRYRVWANVLIAVGTVVIAAAGSRARAGQTAALLLWGFLKAGTLDKGAKTGSGIHTPHKPVS